MSQRLGHARVSTTLNVYAPSVPRCDRKAAETLAAILASGQHPRWGALLGWTSPMRKRAVLEEAVNARSSRNHFISEGVAIEHDYERVFREAGPGLFRALYAFTGGQRQVAEDAMAEAFALAMAHHGIRDPAAWIYRTSLRLARREMERERRGGPLEGDVGQEPPEFHDLLRALRALSPNQRAAVVLRYEADLPVKEVARMMGLSAPTVRVHLHRARRHLRELLGTEEEQRV